MKIPFEGSFRGARAILRETPCKCARFKGRKVVEVGVEVIRGCSWHVVRSKISTKPVMNGTEKAKVDFFGHFGIFGPFIVSKIDDVNQNDV